MKEDSIKENAVIEYLKLLKKHGRLDEAAVIGAIDVLSEPGNSNLLKEFLEEQAPLITDIALNGKPFAVPDESADGPIRFAIAENGQHVGFYPH